MELRGHPLEHQLAKRLRQNYSNVHGDVTKLMEHGLVEKDEEW